MTKPVLNARGKGAQWMRREGPYAHLNCADAIEAFGYNLDSQEAEDFDAGANAAVPIILDDMEPRS